MEKQTTPLNHNEFIKKHRVIWFLAGIAAVMFAISLFFYPSFQAMAFKNAGMLAVLQVLAANESNPTAAHQGITLLTNTLDRHATTPRLPTIVPWLERYIERAAVVEDALSQLALIDGFRHQPMLSTADQQHLEMLATDGWIEARLILASFYQQQNNASSFQQTLEYLHTWSPQHLNARPYEWQEWHLEGFDRTNLTVRAAQPQEYLVLYWRNVSQDDQSRTELFLPAKGVYLVGGRLFQVMRSTNALDNGDFEWIQLNEITTKPFGYELRHQTEDLGTEAYQVILDPNDSQNNILRTTNTCGTVILFRYLPNIRKDQAYLHIGRLRSDGKGFFGIREWITDRNRFSMLVSNLNDSTWKTYARIFTPDPHGRTHYSHFGVSSGDVSWAEFDDLGIFEINPPFDMVAALTAGG